MVVMINHNKLCSDSVAEPVVAIPLQVLAEMLHFLPRRRRE